MLIFSNMQVKLDEMVVRFLNQFDMKELKTVKCALGISKEDRSDMIKIHNEPMIKKMFTYFNMSDCKALGHSYFLDLDLVKDIGSELKDHTPYRQFVKTLKQLANTVRSDISYEVI